MKEEIIEGNKLIAVVYMIKNDVNQKIYIGSSANFSRRRKRHIEDLKSGKHHCKPLQRAVDKYGIDRFIIDTIEKFTFQVKEEILKKEQFYLDDLKPEYNVCKIAGSQLGSKRSIQFKENCSKRLIGKPTWNKGKKTGAQSQSTITKRSNSLIGKRFSEKTKDKIRQAVSNPVIQKDIHGNTIKEWGSLKEVSKKLPCSHGRLSEYLSGKSNIGTYKNFIWILKR